MMKFTQRVVAVLLTLSPLAALALGEGEQVVKGSKPILARPSEPVVDIKLDSNPSTGYRWMLASSYNPLILMPVDAKYYPNNKKMPGAGGYVLWRFRLKAGAFVVPQVIKIELLYAKPWDIQDGHKREFVIVTE